MRISGGLIVWASFLFLGVGACGGASRLDELAGPRTEAPSSPPALAASTENDVDRSIRVQLDRAFSGEPGVKERAISFTVDNGDVAMTGTVRTEAESDKANDLAIHVPGVRSVANALRISE